MGLYDNVRIHGATVGEQRADAVLLNLSDGSRAQLPNSELEKLRDIANVHAVSIDDNGDAYLAVSRGPRFRLPSNIVARIVKVHTARQEGRRVTA